MRLIDADALMEAINTWPKFGVDERCRIVPWSESYEPYIHLRDAVIAITGMPTIEPKIVRCKDCKYWDTDYGLYGYCGRHGYHVSTFREGFCNLADRRK